MRLIIKYFGMLSEATGQTEEEVQMATGKVQDVIEQLFQKYPLLKKKQFQIALNQIIVTQNTPLQEGEIALLPPFSGG